MDAWYAFCFAPATKVVGMDLNESGWEEPVDIEVRGPVAAVISQVPRARFEGAEAERNLGDLRWLLPRVEAHDRVITRTMSVATVFPLRFGTLFSSRQALAIEIARRRRHLKQFFTVMDRREEWAVKALLVRERAIEARRVALFPDTVSDEGSSGRHYLLRQRQKGLAEQALGPWLTRLAADLAGMLGELSETVLVRPPQEPAFGNWACLLEEDRVPRFRLEIARLAAQYADLGVEIHCSGPWPLYSFCGTA